MTDRPLPTWRVTFGNPRKGTYFELLVQAENPNAAKLKARRAADERGHRGRAGTVRLHEGVAA